MPSLARLLENAVGFKIPPGGTEGSDPAPSSAESHANPVLPAIAVGHRRIRAVCVRRFAELPQGQGEVP